MSIAWKRKSWMWNVDGNGEDPSVVRDDILPNEIGSGIRSHSTFTGESE